MSAAPPPYTPLDPSTLLGSQERLILAHRYLYYVVGTPLLADPDYDALEKRVTAMAPPESPVHLPGSDLSSSYPTGIRDLADSHLRWWAAQKGLDRVVVT